MIPLPIDPLLPAVCGALRERRTLVLEAPPGAGKTTRVPRAMLDAGLAGDGEILVLEPRRIAARMAARRVAEELGEPVGETIGYQMRFEEAVSRATRVRFVTEGILTRRLLGDQRLDGVSAVVLDEFHERHIQGDVALALLRRLQRGPRADLALVVMSATLESAPVAAFLGDAPVLRAEGRRFDVEVEHLARSDDRPLASQVLSAVRRLLDEEQDGDVLVFLPGAAEIRRALEACAPLARERNVALLPLHGSLSPAEQDRAVGRSERRKVILSTNVAESSVTIDGVVGVVDSGLARVAAHASWSGLPTLRVARVSRASAEQRAGRAGRTRPGRCLRLYTRGDLTTRPEHDQPEVARADLAETALELHASGAEDLGVFAWFEAPPPASLAAAEALLCRLGALQGGRITDVGRRMLGFPVHPRLARMIVEAERRGIAEDGCALAAIIGERDLRAAGAVRFGTGQARRRASSQVGGQDGGASHADVLDALAAFEEAEQARFSADRLRAIGLDPARTQAADRVARQLRRIARKGPGPGGGHDARPDGPAALEAARRITILAGYPDRVGRVRRPETATGRTGTEIVFASGGTAIFADDGAWDTELCVAVDVEERTEGRTSRVVVRQASAVDPDWLLELHTEAVRDETRVTWSAAAERAVVTRTLSYDGLVLEEAQARGADRAGASAALAAAARAKGWRAFVPDDELDRFLARVAFLGRHCPELELPALGPEGIDQKLSELCAGLESFAELRDADLGSALRGALTPAQARQLAELAPDAVVLPGGRRARIDYAPEIPSVASRLQDFFGMATGPTVARGRVPLVLHLLAPNQRAVQITTDLAGFWAKHYPAIARELRRRYPRHAWPDDPLHAAPPAPPKRR